MSLPMDLYPKRRRISPYFVAALLLFSLCLCLGFFILPNRGKLTQQEEEGATIVVETVTGVASSDEVAQPSVTPVPTKPPVTSTPTLSPTTPLPTKPPVLDIQTPIPAATFTPAPAFTPTAPLGSVLADPLNFRAGPALDYEIIDTLPKGTRLELLARNQPGDWLHVRLDNGQEGWVYAEYVYTTIDITVLQIAAEVPPPPSPTFAP